jgi:hypothetical protein
LARRLQKHRAALLALAVYNFALFFPIAFMGRVVSPNDIYYNYYPWSTVKPAEVVLAQNSSLNDPATAYLTLMSLARDDWRTFHWNPYVASGIPGFGSSAAAILSPFILIPALLVPQTWIYTAILFLKLNASFLFAYCWLREERLGKRGSAVGAIVIAGAGIYAVRWLWQITNATALYPALLWIVRRTLNGKRNSIALVALVALAYALSGFPAAMAYGAWMVVLYLVAAYGLRLVGAYAPGRRGSRNAPLATRNIFRDAAGVFIACAIALPMLVSFVQLLQRSGYLEARQTTSLAAVFPVDHFRNFIEPDRLGHHAYKNWKGDPRLGALNNYAETTLYLGLLTLPLMLLGIFNRRARARWFWLAFTALVLACIFGAPGIAPFVAKLPGFKFSALARVALLLPVAAGYLAAAGTRFLRFRVLMLAAAVIISFDLALVAGRFYPYLTPAVAQVPLTPMMQFLREEKGPYRVAPFFDYFWPNTAELVRFEDVRSHFGSELAYRRMLLRLDPGAWSGTSTVLTLNSINFKYADPLTGLLGIRWYLEHNVIDIIKWSIFSATVPGVQEISGWIPLRPNVTLQRTIRVDAEPFWSIELPVRVDDGKPSARLDVELVKNGTVVWSRQFAKNDVTAIGKVYIPLRPYARLGESAVLRVRASNMKAFLLEGANDHAGETRFFYGRVTVPVMFERELPDGRLFRNLAELPRFRAVSRLRKLNDEEFLAATDVDFATEAVITDDPVMPPQLGPANARVTLASYAPDEQRVLTDSDAPFYLASSEKLTPELRATLDGRAARLIETDSLFAGLQVPAGKHELLFTRRIGRNWWWTALLGALLWAAVAVREVTRRPGRRNMTAP